MTITDSSNQQQRCRFGFIQAYQNVNFFYHIQCLSSRVCVNKEYKNRFSFSDLPRWRYKTTNITYMLRLILCIYVCIAQLAYFYFYLLRRQFLHDNQLELCHLCFIRGERKNCTDMKEMALINIR